MNTKRKTHNDVSVLPTLTRDRASLPGRYDAHIKHTHDSPPLSTVTVHCDGNTDGTCARPPATTRLSTHRMHRARCRQCEHYPHDAPPPPRRGLPRRLSALLLAPATGRFDARRDETGAAAGCSCHRHDHCRRRRRRRRRRPRAVRAARRSPLGGSEALLRVGAARRRQPPRWSGRARPRFPMRARSAWLGTSVDESRSRASGERGRARAQELLDRLPLIQWPSEATTGSFIGAGRIGQRSRAAATAW